MTPPPAPPPYEQGKGAPIPWAFRFLPARREAYERMVHHWRTTPGADPSCIDSGALVFAETVFFGRYTPFERDEGAGNFRFTDVNGVEFAAAYAWGAVELRYAAPRLKRARLAANDSAWPADVTVPAPRYDRGFGK